MQANPHHHLVKGSVALEPDRRLILYQGRHVAHTRSTPASTQQIVSACHETVGAPKVYNVLGHQTGHNKVSNRSSGISRSNTLLVAYRGQK